MRSKPAATSPPKVRDLLLTRRGVVFVGTAEAGGARANADQVRAFALELAELGFVLSTRLEARLAATAVAELIDVRRHTLATLAAHRGADRKHEPLFRRFPEGIPADTRALYLQKVLIHFAQAEGQPCLFCGRTGTTHVLSPCQHVVCDHCFDGSSYSACPACEHHVDRSSPFFRPAPARSLPAENVVFERLDLGEDPAAEARALFERLCARPQALSPDDRAALAAIVTEHATAVLAWLPEAIPLRENVAMVFGTLLGLGSPADVLAHARRYMSTATDVLRLIAVYSGTDGSLQAEPRIAMVDLPTSAAANARFGAAANKLLGSYSKLLRQPSRIGVPYQVKRFEVARMSRALRRALLAQLDGLDADTLVEDMLRHRSYWVWVGEFLHPHEYAARFPRVARAFQILRGKAPDGTLAPAFQTFYGRMQAAIDRRDVPALVTQLGARPGELARRLDHILRLAGTDGAVLEHALAAFAARVPALATPILMTLRSHLPTRTARAPVRVYWPKGKVARGVSAEDSRALLAPATIARALAAIEAELLARFARLPPVDDVVIDRELARIVVPFNERTASPSAVSLPRGSRVLVQDTKMARLFLHWCEPQRGGIETDLDLSVAFYRTDWSFVGCCSYYALDVKGAGQIARSAGDLRDAPWPDGATELIDLHVDGARAADIRFAVMVVNAYSGLSFDKLERAFAGLMLREDLGGKHFDPRTVALKFALTGANGIYMPFVLDLRASELHWLDVASPGEMEMNNVETSRHAIGRVAPDLMAYFESGVRASMFDLGLLHAAARARRVHLRGPGQAFARFVRRPDEPAAAFLARLQAGEADDAQPPRADGPPQLALLLRGDLAVPEGSAVYALFREQLQPTLAAADLLATP